MQQGSTPEWAPIGIPQVDRKKGVAVQFHVGALYNRSKSEGYIDENNKVVPGAGRPIYDDVEFVKIMVVGDKDNIIDRPSSELDRVRYPDEYRAFKDNRDQETASGTPLRVLTLLTPPILTLGQVEELRYFKVFTAEQLSEMTDGNSQKFPGIAPLIAKTKQWLDATKSAAPAETMRAALSERDNEIDTLRRQLKELGDRVEKQEAGETGAKPYQGPYLGTISAQPPVSVEGASAPAFSAPKPKRRAPRKAAPAASEAQLEAATTTKKAARK